jgi:DNA-binding response OmpR family regulator
LVILDLILPKKDGLKVLREIKGREEMKRIPVIVLSNLHNSDNIEIAVRLGVTDCLVKSNYTVAQIVEKIRAYLEKHDDEDGGEVTQTWQLISCQMSHIAPCA